MTAPGREMVLVPIELLDKLKRTQQSITPLINPVKDQLLKSMRKLDNTLLDTHLPDDVKSSHINQIEKDLSIYADKVTGVIQQPRPQPTQNIVPTINKDVFSNSFPKTLQSQANNLLTILESKPEKISWDNDTNEVSIHGKKLIGSNIVDLVGDVLRRRKVQPPEYLNEFLHMLAKMNIPEELIRNTDRIAKFRTYKRSDIPDHPVLSNKRKRKVIGSKIGRNKSIKWLSM